MCCHEREDHRIPAKKLVRWVLTDWYMGMDLVRDFGLRWDRRRRLPHIPNIYDSQTTLDLLDLCARWNPMPEFIEMKPPRSFGRTGRFVRTYL
jgi:hypothetical protein